MPMYAEPATSLNLWSSTRLSKLYFPAREWSESSPGRPERSNRPYKYLIKNITSMQLLMPMYVGPANSLNLSSSTRFSKLHFPARGCSESSLGRPESSNKQHRSIKNIARKQLLMSMYAEPAASINLSISTRLSKLHFPARGWSEGSPGRPESSNRPYRYFIQNITGDTTFNVYVRGAPGFCDPSGSKRLSKSIFSCPAMVGELSRKPFKFK